MFYKANDLKCYIWYYIRYRIRYYIRYSCEARQLCQYLNWNGNKRTSKPYNTSYHIISCHMIQIHTTSCHIITYHIKSHHGKTVQIFWRIIILIIVAWEALVAYMHQAQMYMHILSHELQMLICFIKQMI